MAKTIQFYSVEGPDTIDLYTAGFSVLYDTWQTNDIRPGVIQESFSILATSTTETDILRNVEKMNQWGWRCREFATDRQRYYPIFFRVYAASEDVKQALVYDILVTPLHIGGITPSILGQGGAEYHVVVTRKAEWEEDQNYIYPSPAAGKYYESGTNVSTIGGTVALHDPGCSLSPRIDLTEVSGVSGSGPLDRVWMGIRPENVGVTDFEPVWQLGYSTLGTDATKVDDTEGIPPPYSKNSVAVSFTTTTANAERLSISVSDIIGGGLTDARHFFGRYLVLLRCKLSAAQEVAVQMRAGTGTINPYPSFEQKYINNTNYRYVPMGEIEIMPFMVHYGQGAPTADWPLNYGIEIWAERIGTATTLTMNCLVLIPSQHFCYAENNSIKLVGSGLITKALFYTLETDEQYTIDADTATGTADAGVVYSFRNWELPHDGGVLVFAGERTSVQNKDDVANIAMQAVRRYRTHNYNTDKTS